MKPSFQLLFYLHFIAYNLVHEYVLFINTDGILKWNIIIMDNICNIHDILRVLK